MTGDAGWDRRAPSESLSVPLPLRLGVTALLAGAAAAIVLSPAEGQGAPLVAAGFAAAAAVRLRDCVSGARSRLDLHAEGFVFRTWLGREAVRWDEVACFVPVRAWRFRGAGWVWRDRTRRSLLARRPTLAVDRVLPHRYGLSAEALAALLEARRERSATGDVLARIDALSPAPR